LAGLAGIAFAAGLAAIRTAGFAALIVGFRAEETAGFLAFPFGEAFTFFFPGPLLALFGATRSPSIFL